MPPTDASISVAKSILQAVFVLFSLWIVGLAYLAREFYNQDKRDNEKWISKHLATGLSLSSFVLYNSFIIATEVLRNQTSNELLGLSITFLELTITSGVVIGLWIITQTEPSGLGGEDSIPLRYVSYSIIAANIFFGLIFVFLF